MFPGSLIALEQTDDLVSEGIRRSVCLLETIDGQWVRILSETAEGTPPEGAPVLAMRGDQILVRKAAAVSWSEFADGLAQHGATCGRILPDGETALVQIDDFKSLDGFDKALASLSEDKEIVAWAEPDYLRTSAETVNDPYANSFGSWGQPYPDQWYLGTTRVFTAWDYVSASNDVVVAVIDTGADMEHPELVGQIWTNADETPDNDLDDDGNGYVDDINGYDFRTKSPDKLQDVHGHGTAMAGLIASLRNNHYGIAGIARRAKIMVLKNGNGVSFVSDNVEAIYYAISNGAQVINMSYSGRGFSELEKDAVDAAFDAGLVLVASSGNTGQDDVRYPASHESVLSVGASTPNDTVADFSTYNSYLDFVAPGQDILTLASRWPVMNNKPGFYFMRADGTSFSAAFVSAVAALIRQQHPSMSPAEIRTRLRNTADVLAEPPMKQGYGRVNAYRALLFDTALMAHIEAPEHNSIVAGTVDVTGTAAGSGFDHYILSYAVGEFGDSFTAITTGTGEVTSGLLGTWDTTPLTDGYHTVRLETYATSGTTVVERILVRVGNTYGQLVPGWPMSVYELPCSGTAADIDGDGVADFVGTGGYCDIGIVDGNGTPLSGWSRKSYYPAHNTIANAAAGDLDGDGHPEVVFETRYQNVTTHDSEFSLRVYDYVGNVVTGWPKDLFKGTDFESNSSRIGGPILADIDNDGLLEILTIGADQDVGSAAIVYAYNGDGSSVSNWPVTLAAGTLGSNGKLAAADFNGDGRLDVAGTTGNGLVFVLDANGSMLSGWPVSLGPSANQGGVVAFADFDNDGDVELFAAMYSGHAAIYEADGSLAPGWPQAMPERVLLPAIADFDGDGDLEIVIPSVGLGVGESRMLYVWHHDGTPASGWPISDSDYGAPIIIDFDGDGQLDIIIASVSQSMALEFTGTSKAVLGLPRPGGIANHCLAGDFTGDGTLELLLTEDVVPFSIAMINYPTRTVDPEYMPYPQPGIDARRNNAYIPGRLNPPAQPVLKLERESFAADVQGVNLVRGHSVSVGGIACEVATETVGSVCFTIPTNVPIGTHNMVVGHTAYGPVTFTDAVIVVEEFSDYEGGDAGAVWTLRYQPAVSENAEREPHVGPMDDYDGDGLLNSMEAALRGMGYSQTEPDVFVIPGLQWNTNGVGFEYVFDENMNVVDTVEMSLDLTNWYPPGHSNAPASLEVVVTGAGADPGLVIKRVTVTTNDAAYLFMRFKLEATEP